MGWSVFGVKTVYRTEARSRARRKDAQYDPSTTLVEERVVIVRARNLEEAIRRAEAEARTYVRGMSFRNVYGERVRPRYMGACDAFKLFDKPEVGAEVFSATRLVPRRTRDRTVLNQIIGPPETQHTARRRWRFVDHSLTRDFFQTEDRCLATTPGECARVMHTRRKSQGHRTVLTQIAA